MTAACSSRLLRILAPALIIILWLAGTAFGGPTFGKISSVSSNEQSSFLPADAEATVVANAREDFQDANVVPAVIIVTSRDGGPVPRKPLREVTTALAEVDGVAGVVPGQQKAEAITANVLIDRDQASVTSVVAQLRDVLDEKLPDELAAHVSGPAGLAADFGGAFAGVDGLLLVVALAAVFIILVVVYRSLLLPLLVLANSVAALSVAILGVYFLAKTEVIVLNGQAQGILSILVIGAATDYALLLTARYREELHTNSSHIQALIKAWKASLGAILASATTVVAALLLLLFSQLNSNRALGPIAAIGILTALVASLTLLPALLAAGARVVFWPRIPRYQSGQVSEHPMWQKLADWVRRYARPAWVLTTVVLLAAAAAVTGLRADGVPQSQAVLGDTDAKIGQAQIDHYFHQDTASPVEVLVPQAQAEQAEKILRGNQHIAQLSYAGQQGHPAPVQAQAKVVDGKVLILASLAQQADSPEARAAVNELRANFAQEQVPAKVGGPTAVFVDTTAAAEADLHLLIPLVLGAVLVILIVLLRSLLTPVLLIAATTLSFLAALGVSSLVFNHLLHFPGADPSVPLFGFVFLVALGVDYTIFLMTRARQDHRHAPAGTALHHALVVTGSVITSAGVVLATTFAALSVIPLMFMVQIAFLVAFGVLLDTFIIRSLLIPALGFELGEKLWWPSKKIFRKAE